MGKKINVIKRISIIFFALMVLCTFLSKTISKILLPTVELVNISNGSLQYNFNAEGIVKYGNSEEIISKGIWYIEDILVRPGQFVDKDQVLAKVDLKKLEEVEKEKKFKIMNIEYEIKNLKKAEEIDRDAINIKSLELEIANSEYTQIKDGLSNNGEILSTMKGKISIIKCNENAKAEEGSILFEISNINSDYNITWKAGIKDAMNLNIGLNVDVSFQGFSSIKKIQGTVISKKYLEQEGLYEFVGEVKRENLNNEILSEEQEVSVSYSNKIGDNYSMLPKECVVQNGDGNNLIYVDMEREGLFGTENYIDEVKVEIIASDNSKYAIKDIGNNIKGVVLSSSKPIEKDKMVKLR